MTDQSSRQGQNAEGPQGQSRSSGSQGIPVFDLEGEVRKYTTQDLAHMQLLLDSKLMKMFVWFLYHHRFGFSVVKYGHVMQNQRKGKTL